MNNIKLFQTKEIRSTWNESDQQWFVVSDVVQVLPKYPYANYLEKMRRITLNPYLFLKIVIFNNKME
jgi:prophage antirepressor-like protein